MRELLISVVRCSTAILWVCFVGPSLARLFGIPIRATFWKSDPHDQQLTRQQFMWVFGVLVFGICDVLRENLLKEAILWMDAQMPAYLFHRDIEECIRGASGLRYGSIPTRAWVL